MLNSREILVTTTSSLDGIAVKQYLKPVSAHVVAGTNLFSDFFASFSDIFGGRSGSYQKQLTSLYNEAIEKLKIAAYEAGGNCVVGLHIDLDEISGKNKSMFMLTAIGTAVIIEMPEKKKIIAENLLKLDNISSGKLQELIRKNEIIKQAELGELNLEENVWDFITQNQVYEVYNYVVARFQKAINAVNENPSGYNEFRARFLGYMDSVPDKHKSLLIHQSMINTDDERLALKLAEIIGELEILDLDLVIDYLGIDSFEKRKRITRLLLYDKSFYNQNDIDKLKLILDKIQTEFVERGVRSMKKQLLSSKEKEVWTCECSRTNDIDTDCTNCLKDIYGFTVNDVRPARIVDILKNKIDLITGFIK